MSGHGHVIDIDIDLDAAIEKVSEALKTEGFGVITRIDIDEAFREKLGVDFRRYVILGACNPQLAHKALSADPEVGMMLPCNVCVEEIPIGSRVHFADPVATMTAGGFDDNPELHELGKNAGVRLARAAAAIAKFSTPG
jgi:uncharacterized protein (DUF302 family)